MSLNQDLFEQFCAIVGTGNALIAAQDIAPHLTENRDLYHGLSSLVLKPKSVDEVSAIMKLASETATPIVPQGGNTGLVGAQTPNRSGTAVILSLARMNQIRDCCSLVRIVVRLQDVNRQGPDAFTD